MRWRRNRVGWVGATLLLVSIFGVWQIVRLKLSVTTRDRVLAVIPSDLLVTAPTSEESRKRFDDAFDTLSQLKDQISSRSWKAGITKKAALKLSNSLLANPVRLRLQEILRSGTISYDAQKLPPTDQEALMKFQMNRNMCSWVCMYAVQMLAESGDYAGALKLIDFCLLISYRLDVGPCFRGSWTSQESRTSIYLAIHNLTQQADTPIWVCKAILDRLSPAPTVDQHLVDAIRLNFQSTTLEILPNPAKWLANHPEATMKHNGMMGLLPDYLVGKYDPVQAAKRLARLEMICLDNARKPLKQTNYEPESSSFSAFMSLPREPEDTIPKSLRAIVGAERWVVSLAKNQNMIESWMVSSIGIPQLNIQASCRWRAMLDVLRVQIACRIFCFEHLNEWPSSERESIPYLHSMWPTDPFDGKPLRFNRKKLVVYSVGSDCQDNGGKLSLTGSFHSDLGVSLVLKPKPTSISPFWTPRR